MSKDPQTAELMCSPTSTTAHLKDLPACLSEALVPLICFLKCCMMFVSTEDIQTMILSTEWPLCHVGELRYGLTKFFGGNPKNPENAFLTFDPILMHLYSSKWYSEAPTHRK